jgi:MFS family permease
MTNAPLPEESPPSPSLRAATKDGMAHAVMIGAGETYLGVFGIFLRATTPQVGLLATLPAFIGAIFQAVAVFCMPFFKTRRQPIVVSAVINALVWLPIALLPFVLGPGSTTVSVLIVLVTIYHVAGNFGAPLWNSLIGDLVPAHSRGRYFGGRNRLIGLATFLAVLIAGHILDLSRTWGDEALGFLVVFSVAAVARLLSAWWLSHYDDPPLAVRKEEMFSFYQFIRRLPRSNFARFVLFFATINFAVAFAGPYFALYMLRDLKLSYFEFTLVGATMTVTQFLTMQHWGRLSDRFGTKKILNICGIAVAVSPVLWLFSAELWWILVTQIYAGFVWAGFNLASTNFMFDAVTPPKRARCAAYQALVNGAFVVAGSLLGGVTADALTALGRFTLIGVEVTQPLLVLFFISGILRVIAAWLLLPQFQEVRPVEQIAHRHLVFQITNLRPLSGATFSVMSGFLPGRRRKRRALDHSTNGERT